MKKSVLASTIAALAVYGTSGSAVAGQLEEMIVTGSRVAESQSEVPASVAVVGRAEIEQQMRVSPELQNMLAIKVPGMAPATGTSSNSAQTLRGRNALVMIDGVPQSTPLRNGSLGIRTLDGSVIERIEVVKGASSVYGNGAAGGMINYITRKPDESRNVGGEASVLTRFSAVDLADSFGQRLNGTVDGSVDKFSYVLSATYDKTGLERDAEGDIIGLIYGLSETTTQNYFTKLGYQLDDDQALQVTYNYYESQQDADLVDVPGSVNSGTKTYAIKDTSGEPKPGVPQGPRGNHNVMAKYTHDALFANTQFVADVYQQKIENVFFFSSALANPDEGYTGGQSMIKSVKSGARFSFNTAVNWDGVDATFIYGLDALNDTTSQPLVDGRVWVPEMDMRSKALYLQSKWVVAEDIVIKTGVRSEDIDISVDDYSTLKLCRTAETCSVPLDVTGGEINYNATTYNLGLRYNGFSGISPFVNYSQGADVSDIGRLLRTATVEDIALIRTDASLIDHYEVGFASDFDNLSIEVAAYRSTSELGTGSEYNAETGVYMPVRAPQKIWGYEGQFEYQVNEDLTAGATYTWVEGKDTENDVYLGGRQISAPKFTAYVDWAFNSNGQLHATVLRVGDRDRFEAVDGNYVGDQGPIESYTIVNLSATYSFGNWLAQLGVENLFNQDYYPARSQVYTYNGYNTKGLGTTVNAGVTYSF